MSSETVRDAASAAPRKALRVIVAAMVLSGVAMFTTETAHAQTWQMPCPNNPVALDVPHFWFPCLPEKYDIVEHSFDDFTAEGGDWWRARILYAVDEWNAETVQHGGQNVFVYNGTGRFKFRAVDAAREVLDIGNANPDRLAYFQGRAEWRTILRDGFMTNARRIKKAWVHIAAGKTSWTLSQCVCDKKTVFRGGKPNARL